MATFDTLSEPWIPVLRDDGGIEELGLRDVLIRAPDLRGVRDPFPTVEFGLYRLLVALVVDIFQPADTVALGDLLDAGAFDEGVVDDYLARWAGRFDLFDARYPFLQTPGMEGEAAKPLAGLLPAIPSGTNVSHFHHVPEYGFGVCPAAAARMLSLVAPFMTAGGAGLAPSINGAPPWYVQVEGQSLFHTLCLNAPVAPFFGELPASTPPAWRNDDPPRGDGRSTDTSLLEALTWRPRRIQLIAGEPGCCSLTGRETPVLVRSMRFAAGASCDLKNWRDPSVPYRITEKGPSPLRPQEGRELWRDTGPIALLRRGAYRSERGALTFERPTLVSQYAKVCDRQPLRLAVYGMRTDMKMKVFEWQRVSLPELPAGLVKGDGGGEAQRAMDRADSVAYHLKQAIKHAYPRQGKGNSKAFDGRVAAAQRRFWSELRPAYHEFLHGLAGLPESADYDADLQGLRLRWESAATRSGGAALAEAIEDLDTDADALHRLVEARRYFGLCVWKVFNPEAAAAKKARRKGVPADPRQTEGGR